MRNSSKAKSNGEHGGLELRVAALEAEVAVLRGNLAMQHAASLPGWKIAIEKYAGDKDLQCIFTEAMKLREADRKRARRARPARKTKK